MRSGKAKALHNLAGFPMITHVRRLCESLEPARIIGVLAEGAEDAGAALEPHGAVIQKERKGTAHAVMMARAALKDFGGRILVVYGDTPLLRPETLSALVGQRAPVSLLVFESMEPNQYGRVFLNDEGMAEHIIEYADASAAERRGVLCNAGVMAFDSSVLWRLLDQVKPHNAKGEFYLTDTVALARKEGLSCGSVRCAEAEEAFGVNSRADLAVAEKAMQRRLRLAAMENGVTLADPDTVYFSADTRLARDVTVGPHVMFGVEVEVESGVDILPFSHLEGVRVESGARIGPFARLRPGTRVGAGAHVGNFVEVKKADINAGAKINHLSYIGDAHVGARSNIGAGVICCNYDGVLKHRTGIGAEVFVGSNASLVAPLEIGEGAVIAAGSVVTESVPPQALSVARARQEIKPDWARRWREKQRAQNKVN